jgi:hypothetical protein
MRKEKKHLVLDGDVTDGLKPFLAEVGMSLSGYIRFVLAQTYAQFNGMEKEIDFRKPISEISIGDIVKVSQVLTRISQEEKMIDLTDAMTDEEKIQAEVSGAACFD